MATLPPQYMHELKRELSICYDEAKDAERVLISIGLRRPIRIDLTGFAYEFWQRILESEWFKDQGEHLVNLLRFVTREKEFPDNKVFNGCLEEILYGKAKRLKIIVDAIRSRKCILFLGPNVLRCEEDGERLPFNKFLARQMAKEMKLETVFFDEKQHENLSYIAQRYTKIPNSGLGEQGRKACDVYNESKSIIIDTVYRKLARLPWKLVINTNPDNQLKIIMDAENPGHCQHAYYSIANQPVSSNFPADYDGVLLYNLFGSFEDESSILLSESQFLSFTRQALAKAPALDPKVWGEFESKDYYYLFLGFDFEQWYPKIIFDTILKLTREKDHAFSVLPKHKDLKVNQSNREFFEEEFKIYFEDDDMDRYLDDIINGYFNR